MIGTSRADESSPRYAGWRVVAACFLVELFIFGFGLYGQGVYLSELRRLHGWPISLVSAASTLSLLVGSLLAAFTTDVLAWMGARRLLLAGIGVLALSLTLLAMAVAPWQLYLAMLLMGLSWTAMGTVVAATIVSGWFEHRRGLALSLTFNGATCGGIVLVPALVALIGAMGFTAALLVAAAFMTVVLAPVVTIVIRQSVAPAQDPASRQGAGATPVRAPASRWRLLAKSGFWTITAPFALALTAQVGFLVHQIAILEPSLGAALAALTVSISATMSITGRTCLGLFVDRLDPRLTTAVSVLTQAAALIVITQTANVIALFAACAVFGLSIGNLITLPALIIQREFPTAMFSMVMGLSVAIGGMINALGPAAVGLLRDSTGSYAAPLMLCVVLEVVSAAIVLFRPRPTRS